MKVNNSLVYKKPYFVSYNHGSYDYFFYSNNTCKIRQYSKGTKYLKGSTKGLFCLCDSVVHVNFIARGKYLSLYFEFEFTIMEGFRLKIINNKVSVCKN